MRRDLIAPVIALCGDSNNHLNGSQAELIRLAQEHQMSAVLIEFRDRLTRFAYPYVSEYLAASGMEAIVTNSLTSQTATDQAMNQELVEILIGIIYSFSGKLYGRRLARFRKLRRCVREVLTADAEEPGPISKALS